jgi:transcriptional regulator GlxA family with amidase domain
MKKTLAFLIILLGTTGLLRAQIHGDCDSTATEDEKLHITLLNHQKVMKEIYGEPLMEIKTIGILVYDGVFTLDAVGPMCVLSELMNTKVYYIGLKKGIVKSGRTKIVVDKTIDDIKSLDILIVPGGSNATWKASKNEKLLAWIKKIDEKSTITASVCTGAWILGAAGLLQGKTATTHWYRGAEILPKFGATFVEKRYTNDGKYWTSAGVTAGMDMSLALIKEIRGEKYLQGAMLDLEYNPQPPIDAGTPAKSDKKVLQMMEAMYDYVMLPLLNKEEKKAEKDKK